MFIFHTLIFNLKYIFSRIWIESAHIIFKKDKFKKKKNQNSKYK